MDIQKPVAVHRPAYGLDDSAHRDVLLLHRAGHEGGS